MPLIRVELTVGRTLEQRRRFAEALAESAETCLGARRSAVRVIYRELETSDLIAGGALAAQSSTKPGAKTPSTDGALDREPNAAAQHRYSDEEPQP